MQGPQVSRQLV